MTLKQRIDAFAQAGAFIQRHFNGNRNTSELAFHEGLDKVIELAGIYNNWFIPKFVNDALIHISGYLNEKELTAFSGDLKEPAQKKVAIICAGNIPMVGFHDVMCVLLSGHVAIIKLSTDDNLLLPFFLKLLTHYEPALDSQIRFADGRLSNFDAVIATGSDNTASHFHYYFGKYPNIIRKSRTSVAVLTGKETREQLKALGTDIFQYFGLGCRNVSKLLVPKGYSFNTLFESIVDFGFVVNNKKYGNNYEYHRAIYLLEQHKFLDNNFVMIKESPDLHSPVGVIYYEFYNGSEDVKQYLQKHQDHIQCVVGEGSIPFGYSQQPVISEYADKVDTLRFLVNL
jgi:hypothetical protein